MTIREWLHRTAAAHTSNETDATQMQELLRQVGFPKAVCTCGVVYLEGKGTPEAPPTDIHTMARIITKLPAMAYAGTVA
jgi:hypothetical protein